MLAVLFRALDLDPVTLNGAEEALSLMEREEFDLYVFDDILGRESGVLLCKTLRAMNSVAPIVIFSGNKDARDAALSAGANAFVFKPNVEELTRTVFRLLQARSGVASDLPWN
jgi:DNA-binding response OmpR family regulator